MPNETATAPKANAYPAQISGAKTGNAIDAAIVAIVAITNNAVARPFPQPLRQ